MSVKHFMFSVTAKDCEWQYFSVGGHGGAGKDTSNTGVRVVHPPSGAVGTARDERSQVHNRRLAFRRMAESDQFKAWVKRAVAAGMRGDDNVWERVEAQMVDGNLLIEGYTENGIWEKIL